MNAIETWYGGILFRSRLEAKWAAFFDALGWRWEYEPFDLNGYIPDFFLPDFKTKLIVEVKPAITNAAKEKIDRSGWDGEALLVGSGPRPSGDSDGWEGWALGDLREEDRFWGAGVLGCAKPWPARWGDYVSKCDRGFGLVHSDGGYNCRRCGDYDGNVCGTEEDVELLWRSACNATRWQPGKSMPAPVPERCHKCDGVITNKTMAGYGTGKDGSRIFTCWSCVSVRGDGR